MSNPNQYKGEILVFFGPMFSGKTTHLIQKINEFEKDQKKVLVIGFAHDCRYSSENKIVAHNKQTHLAKKCFELKEIDDIYQNYDVIAIDEGQFFLDIADKCDEYANNGKIVVVAALDATFQRKAFNQILNLVPIAEQVFKLKGDKCSYCDKYSSFSNRKIKSQQVELIGGEEIYESVCRNCYFKRQEQKQEDTTTKYSDSISSNEYLQDEDPIKNTNLKQSADNNNVKCIQNNKTLNMNISSEDNSTENDQTSQNEKNQKQQITLMMSD